MAFDVVVKCVAGCRRVSAMCALLCLAASVAALTESSAPEYAPVHNVDCSQVKDCSARASCQECELADDERRCVYGQTATYVCKLNSLCHSQHSQQDKRFERLAECRYCWQTEPWEHACVSPRNCSVGSRRLVRAVCTANEDVVCLGRRAFYKNVRCNWTNGYRWSTALLFSVTLGGFGVDRFYLGLWKSAIGKLFSFGGLGVWTVVDVVLIAAGYVTPADGSLYI